MTIVPKGFTGCKFAPKYHNGVYAKEGSPHKLFTMQYVYILKSMADKKLYIGCTSNLKRRFSEHNAGRVPSTKNRIPFEMIFYESLINPQDAFAREKWFKTGFGYNHIRKMLNRNAKKF